MASKLHSPAEILVPAHLDAQLRAGPGATVDSRDGLLKDRGLLPGAPPDAAPRDTSPAVALEFDTRQGQPRRRGARRRGAVSAATAPRTGLRRMLLASALALAAAGGAAAQGATDVPAPVPIIDRDADSTSLEHRFADALREYECNHWPQTYAALARLADDGHPEAARIALQMWQHGPALYGQAFVASPRQVAQWTRNWGCGGDATSGQCAHAMLVP